MAVNPRLVVSPGRVPLVSRRRLLLGLAIVAVDVALIAVIVFLRWSPPPLERVRVPAAEAVAPVVQIVIAPGPDAEILPTRLAPVVPETAEVPAESPTEPGRERQRERPRDRDRGATATAPSVPVTTSPTTTQPTTGSDPAPPTNDPPTNDDPATPPSGGGGGAAVDEDPPAGPGGSPGGGGGGSGDDGSGPGGT